MPITIKMRGVKKREIDEEEIIEFKDWTKRGEEMFKRKLEEEKIEASWEGMKRAIRKVRIKNTKQNKWWDEECREEKSNESSGEKLGKLQG